MCAGCRANKSFSCRKPSRITWRRKRRQIMKLRKALVEHPFGTIKRGMGMSYFLCKGLDAVRTEMSLTVLAYNLKRVLNILGSKN